MANKDHSAFVFIKRLGNNRQMPEINMVCRFVKNKNGRIMDHGFRHQQPALHAAGKLAHISVGFIGEAKHGQDFHRPALLARHPGVVLPREQILQEVWSSGWKGLGRSLEVHIASLRRKLDSRDIIGTVRGVGYRLVS